MNTLSGYSKSTLTDNFVLSAAGGHLAVGNADKNIPINNGTVSTNLNADLLDDHHETAFMRYRGNIETSYVDLATYTSNATGYKNPSLGIYSVGRGGYSDMMIHFNGSGSTSGLDLLINYNNESRIQVRKNIDSNRVSGAWKTIAWKSDIPTKLSGFTDDILSGKYYPITGGRINGNELSLGTSTNYKSAYFRIFNNTSDSADYGTHLRHYNDGKYQGLIINTAGLYYSNNGSDSILIHTGNYNNYSPTLTGGGASGDWAINITGNATTANSLKVTSCTYNGAPAKVWNTIKVTSSPLRFNVYDSYNEGGPSTYGNIIEIVGINNHWQPQLWFDAYAGGYLRHRNKGYDDNTWGDWHIILDSNNYGSYLGYIGTTSVLKTSATLNLTGIGTISMGNKISSSSTSFLINADGSKELFYYNASGPYLSIGYGSAGAGYTTYLHGNKVQLRYGKSASEGAILDSAGNFGIGTTAPLDKLDVKGNIRITRDSKYLQIKQENDTWTSFYTTATTYYFDKPVEIHGNHSPYVNNSYSSGTSSKRWKNIYTYAGDIVTTLSTSLPTYNNAPLKFGCTYNTNDPDNSRYRPWFAGEDLVTSYGYGLTVSSGLYRDPGYSNGGYYIGVGWDGNASDTMYKFSRYGTAYIPGGFVAGLHKFIKGTYSWSFTTGTWYRILVSDSSSVKDATGELTIYLNNAGYPATIKLSFGVSYHNYPFLHCNWATAWSGSPFTKARIVYKTSYGNQKAYLEVYTGSTMTHDTTFVFSGNGWSFMTPTATTEAYTESLNSKCEISITSGTTRFSNDIYAPNFIGTVAWSNITGKPTIPTVPTIKSRCLSINGTDRYFYSEYDTDCGDVYAPTTAGTSGYVLKSNGSGAPTWLALSSLSVAWANVTGKPTIPTVSSRNLTVNGTAYTFYSSTTTAAASFYAPTSVGSSYQILVSSGSTSYPTPYWENRMTSTFPGIIWMGYIYRSTRSSTYWYASREGGYATVSMAISLPTSSNNYLVALQSSTHTILGGMCSILAQFNAGKDGGQSTEGPLYAYSTVDVSKIEEAGPDVFVTSVYGGKFYIKAMRASDANNSSYYLDGLAFTGAGKDTNSLPLARINVILFGY